MSGTATDQPIEEQMYGSGQDAEELDTEGTPGESVDEAEDDGALAAEGEDGSGSDTDDGTPDDEDSGAEGYEQRYKDLQAEYTQATQELSTLKEEYAGQVGELTEAGLELKQRLDDVEEVSQFYASMAEAELNQLRSMNVQGMSQEQYAQWQQSVNAAGQRAGMLGQRLNALKAHSKKAREDAEARTVHIARAQLTRTIDDFDEVYPDIGKFAVSQGVSPQAFREITDPGLIKIIHGYMQATAEPDAIDKVVKKTQARRKMPSARRIQKAAPKTLADKLYGSN